MWDSTSRELKTSQVYMGEFKVSAIILISNN